MPPPHQLNQPYQLNPPHYGPQPSQGRYCTHTERGSGIENLFPYIHWDTLLLNHLIPQFPPPPPPPPPSPPSPFTHAHTHAHSSDYRTSFDQRPLVPKPVKRPVKGEVLEATTAGTEEVRELTSSHHHPLIPSHSHPYSSSD